MSKLPVRLTDYTNQANTSGGVAHRSISHFDGISVIGSKVASTEVAGGVVPLGIDEYRAMMISAIGQSPAAWYQNGKGVTVTGSGVSTWADQSGNGRDLLQGTDANRPIWLPYVGTRYGYLPGVASNYFSTPDPASTPTGDIDIAVFCSADDWTPAATSVFISKYAGSGNRSFSFYLNVSGSISFSWTADGTTTLTSTSSAATGLTDGSVKWLRAVLDVDNGAAGNDTKFYMSDDGVTWVQLGTTQTKAGTTSIFNSATALEVGSDNGGADVLKGKIYRAKIFNSIGGATPVVDFSPQDATDLASSWVSSTTGETWTVNTSGALPAQVVGSPRIMGNGTSHQLATAGFTLNQPLTRYILGRSISWTLNDYIADGLAKDSAAFIQSATTPRFKVSAGSAIGENADLALNTWGVMCGVINGASSLTQVNLGTPVTGNAGAANAGGLTLFANGTVTGGWWNGMVKEDITFPTAHDASTRAKVIQYLAAVGGVSI